jgi:hypothetical protein
MAGFLDRDNRIIDMVLTNNGKRLLSQGDLRFCYWTPFDDEIDYQPYIAESSSLSQDQLSSSIYSSIENTPVREAVSGYRNFNSSGSDTVNVIHPMFTMPQGQKVLPRSVFVENTGTFVISTNQRSVQRIHQKGEATGKFINSIQPQDLGVERFDSTDFSIFLSYFKDSFPSDFQTEGFQIRVLKSGSNGYVELRTRRDMNNDLTYSNDVKVLTGQQED